MQLRQILIERFRGIERLEIKPGPRTIILGPNNSGKSTILEALDLLLHSGKGRPRPNPTETDYFQRDPSAGFQIEAVIGALPADFQVDAHLNIEGWHTARQELVPQPGGADVEPVVRVRVIGTPDFELIHEFSKPESEGARFGPRLREQVGWVFDGRQRDPSYQLAFYQGGLLDRLFLGKDLDPALLALREGMKQGAGAVNDDGVVKSVLGDLADDLVGLGLLKKQQRPEFEAGQVSTREMLQTLRLALPSSGVTIPVTGQGRGAQRLLLVSVLLRLATATGRSPIAAFEEPEEALEPLRQAQIAEMLSSLVQPSGGQIFVVSHSPDVARAFEIDDFLLLLESGTSPARHLRGVLSPPVRQAYERRLDGAVVRGLFARIPLLVEGPGDRAVFAVFWRALARDGKVPRQPDVGLDVVNAEGVDQVGMAAALFRECGKSVAAWLDRDSKEAQDTVDRIRRDGNCAALVLHNLAPDRHSLEHSLTVSCSLASLAGALSAVATDRGYPWDKQREYLVSSVGTVGTVAAAVRDQLKGTDDLLTFLTLLEESHARHLAAVVLGAKKVTPFEMKGGRQARIVAETILAMDGVPHNYSQAFIEFGQWLTEGCPPGREIEMP